MAIAESRVRPQQMYLAQHNLGRGGPSGLADVLDVLLDKGLVIDAFVRVSLIGIELLTIDARIVVAGVDTYLRFAEAVNRLDLLQANRSQDLGELVGGDRSSRSSGDRGNGSKALEGDRGGQEDEASSEETREEEPSSEEPREEEAASQSTPRQRSGSESAEEAGGAEDEEASILARIKERGKVF